MISPSTPAALAGIAVGAGPSIRTAVAAGRPAIEPGRRRRPEDLRPQAIAGSGASPGATLGPRGSTGARPWQVPGAASKPSHEPVTAFGYLVACGHGGADGDPGRMSDATYLPAEADRKSVV